MSETTQGNETVLEVFLLGLKTWTAEVKWLGKSVLTRFEISRLEKELNREYGILGRLAESPRGKKDEKELSLRQIDFLKEEIETLRTELALDREERMSALRKDQD
ncbi:hypothetical protein [Pseudodesulfovibrio piezophilus]|uniref:Uncharacterized protein n=1 Tax=Pseudodesulfovibrio piezophilus (strain DSM 21447 / JCM 15486 / C1TLV30) TaxID=1322246 RepID=M1WKK2_PSEP2|nr:hypothetical protein [Pseudodesulfovibrio piezophilus]CCH49746.1 conserved protein of unknown function [Pseudodesulfovibrio piezophilus C1TLV30]